MRHGSVDLKKTVPGRALTAYEVFVCGKYIGTVESRMRGTFRMHGRIRYPTGREKIWKISDPAPEYPSAAYPSRARAVARLVKDWRDE